LGVGVAIGADVGLGVGLGVAVGVGVSVGASVATRSAWDVGVAVAVGIAVCVEGIVPIVLAATDRTHVHSITEMTSRLSRSCMMILRARNQRQKRWCGSGLGSGPGGQVG